MPINFDAWLASNTKESRPNTATLKSAPWLKPSDIGGTIDTQSNIMAEYVSQIIKAKFPDYASRSDAVLTNIKAEDGAVASTGGFGGNKVNLGKLQRSATTYSSDGKANVNNPKTDEVIDALGVTLHEIMHTRQSKDREGVQKIGIGKDWVKLLEDAQDNFPSIKGSFMNGDSLNEFLATAIAIKDMKARDINPTGRFKAAAEQLPGLEKKYPWLSTYIDINKLPEEPSLRSQPDTLVEQLFGRKNQ